MKDTPDTTPKRLKAPFKMVKNAIMFNDAGVYVIEHYNTKIFEYNPEKQEAWILLHCSRTSDRQIRTAMHFFNPVKTEAIEASAKWSYSGGYQ